MFIASGAFVVAETPELREAGLPPLRNFSPTDYRGHNQVFQTAQDADGVVYMTNYGAVMAWDGERWMRIPVPGSSFLYGVAARADGSLAVCGINVIGLLLPGPGGAWQWRSLLDELSADDRAQVGEVWDLHDTPEGLFFFTRRMMLRWQEERMTVWRFETDKMIYGFWSGSAVYIQNLDHGLYRLDGDEVVQVCEAPFFKAPGPRQILDGDEGGLVVVTMRDALWHWRGGEVEPYPTGADAFLRQSLVNRGLRLADGRLALGTLHGGVAVLTPGGDFDLLVSEATGLRTNTILHLAEDAEGGLWCSLNSGIARVDVSGAVTYFDRTMGLPAVSVTKILRHREDVYLSSGNGLFRLKAVAPPAVPRWEQVAGITGEMFDLLEHDGDLFAAVEGRVLRLAAEEDPETVWRDHGLVRVLYPSEQDADRILVGGRIGLGLVYREDGEWRAGPVVPGLEDDYVQSIVETEDGSVWLGTVFSGLIRLRSVGEGDAWATEAEIERIGPEQGLPTREHLLVEVEDGLLLVNTPSGRFFWDAESATIQPRETLPQRPPLPGWLWDVMVEDDLGRRWATVFPEGGEEDDFLTYAGLQIPGEDGEEPSWNWIPPGLFEPIGGSLYKLIEFREPKVLWVGGWSGLMRWEVSRAPLGVEPRQPVVLVRRVVYAGGDVLHAGAGTPQAWEQAHSRRALRFEFAAPVMTPGVEVRYRTRLEGFEDEWTDWSHEATRSFTNLGGGRYRFMVEAKTELGTSMQPAMVDFRVHPPWYLSGPAAVGYVAFLGLVVWGSVRWRLSASRRENLRLEGMVAARTSELTKSEENLREARDAAEQANRAKSRFLANMSHELRTPLNSIIGYAQILDRDPGLDERNRHRVATLRSSSHHLLNLINEVLDLSRIEAGRIEVHAAPADLRSLVGNLAAAFRPRAEEKSLDLRVAVAPEVPKRLLLDAQKIEQILFNLLGNAVKFTQTGGVALEVSIDRDGLLCILVSDTGPGIPETERAAIFEPFHQVGAGRGAEPGTGLGLAISSRLAAALGGRLSCESGPDRGSRFFLRLPAKVAPVERATKVTLSGVAGYEGPRRRILVVDDLPENRAVVRELLEPLDFTVAEAAGGEEALAALTASPADLVLLDLRMTPVDGAEVLRRLRQLPRGQTLPVVAYSASAIGFTRADALALGFDGWVAKPVVLEDLLETLGVLLALAWTRKTGEPPPEETASAPRFSSVQLQRLRALAHRGEPVGLKNELERIAREDPATRSLVEPLLVLVARFRLGEVSRILDAAEPADPSTS